jgi:hypothetical protein
MMKPRLLTAVWIVCVLLAGCGNPSGPTPKSDAGKDDARSADGTSPRPGPGKDGARPADGTNSRPDDGEDGGKLEAGSYSTPEATWKTVGEANLAGNHKAFICGFAPADQKRKAAELALLFIPWRLEPSNLDDKPKLKESLKLAIAALDKHGLDAETCKAFKLDDSEQKAELLEKLAPLVKGPIGLYTELGAAQKARGGAHRPERNYYADQLIDVKIEGDKATATVVPRSLPKKTITFIKVGDQWRLTGQPVLKD